MNYFKQHFDIIFRILLFIALFISIKNSVWINVLLIGVILFISVLPSLLDHQKHHTRKVETLTLLLVYVAIFIENSITITNAELSTRIFFYFLISIVIGLVGFSLIYLLNQEKQSVFKLSPVFITVFAFCFSLTIGALWQIFRFGMDYIFGISIQQYNASDALGFLAVHSVGAGLISLSGYLLISDQVFAKHLRSILKTLGFYRTSKEEIKELIAKGESETLEFKETLRTNVHTGQVDKRIEYAIFKTITAFLNTRGGVLLIGVKDDGTITGTEQDNFKSLDKMNLHFINLTKQHLGADINSYLRQDMITLKSKTIFRIGVKKSDKPIFLMNNGEEEFYIRTGPSSIPLKGKKLINYTKTRFKK